MISKIPVSRHFEPFTTAQGSRTFSNVAKIRGARGGDVSIERRSFFILGGLILLLCLSLALIYPAARAGARAHAVGSPCTVIDAQMDRI